MPLDIHILLAREMTGFFFCVRISQKLTLLAVPLVKAPGGHAAFKNHTAFLVKLMPSRS